MISFLFFCGEGMSLLGDVRLVMQDEYKDGERSLCVRKRDKDKEVELIDQTKLTPNDSSGSVTGLVFQTVMD